MPISSKGIVIVHSRAQLLGGILLLLLGSLVYVVDRSPDQVYFTRFFGIKLKMFDAGAPVLGSVGLRMPAFFHVLSFSLITGSFFRYGRGRYLVICAFWLLVNICFELGQKYKDLAVQLTPDFFKHIPFLENTKAYFQNGTFDTYDLAAFFLGALVGYGMLLITGGDKGKISNIQ